MPDMAGHVVERYNYTPEREMIADQVTAYSDRDMDGDLDSTDKGKPGSTCTGTVSGARRVLDLDFQLDYHGTDAPLFDNLDQGLGPHPARLTTGLHQPFGHQALLFDAELASYQVRHRQFDPAKGEPVVADGWDALPVGGSDMLC